MKTKLLICLLPLLSGCTLAPKFPQVSFTTWVHTGNYGPITTKYTVSDATLSPDGKTLTVGNYDGQITYMGLAGPHDTFTGLKVIFATPIGTPVTASK